MSRNPWKTLGTEPLLSNPWFSVRRDDVVRPDGARGTYSVVHAERLAVGVIPLWDDGTVTLVGQFRYPLGAYSWEIPEGGGPLGDPAVETAERELREETGIRAGRFDELGGCHLSNCFVDETAQLFVARDLEQGEAAPEGDEELATRRLPLHEAVEMAMDGRIADAMSVVALLRLSLRLSSSLAAE